MKKEQLAFLGTAAEVIMAKERSHDRLMENLDLSIVKIVNDRVTPMKYEHLFEGVPNYEIANLLAQFAMEGKEDYELIAIFPGWNRSIKNNHPSDYADALVLAAEYKYVKMEGKKNESK